MDRRAISVAADVCDLLVQLAENAPDYLDMPYDELPYGEALCRWEDDGCNPRDFFTSDDPYLIYFRKPLMERFRLRILTPDEAEIEKRYGPFQTFKVTGFPSFSDKLN